MNGINDHVRNTCKIGQKSACCRYLVITPHGFDCVKNMEMRAYIDSRVAMETMVARADGCEGKTEKDLNS